MVASFLLDVERLVSSIDVAVSLCYNTYIRERHSQRKGRDNKMRVTKTIRGYIEKKVSEKYADRITAVSKDYHDELEAINNKIREVTNEANAALRVFLETEHSEWAKGEERRELLYSYGPCNRDKQAKKITAVNKLEKEKRDVIEEIIVSLELGGGRAELEEMLSKI